jgi:hypothetical protein
MKSNSLLLFTAVLLTAPLLGPTVVRAQRGARFSASAPAMSVRRGSALTTPAPLRSSRRNASGAANGFFNNSLGNIRFFPTNGLGINGINTIATQNVGIEAAIDPITQWNLALAERASRTGLLGGGGYCLLGGGGYVLPQDSEQSEQPAPQQQQPQVIVVQQPPAQQAVAVSEPPAAVPLPDAGQFTLVLRNGTQIEAVAFTHTSDRIVYITREGARRMIALNDLDAEATLRLNQERGTPLQLPL